jgi:hypothetical protein
MTQIIKAHGFKFDAEPLGFPSEAMDDFDSACDELERALGNLDVGEVARLHAGSIMDDETGDFVNHAAYTKLAETADAACAKATSHWCSPSAAAVLISAKP